MSTISNILAGTLTQGKPFASPLFLTALITIVTFLAEYLSKILYLHNYSRKIPGHIHEI